LLIDLKPGLTTFGVDGGPCPDLVALALDARAAGRRKQGILPKSLRLRRQRQQAENSRN
jgi:hypothetical protein